MSSRTTLKKSSKKRESLWYFCADFVYLNNNTLISEGSNLSRLLYMLLQKSVKERSCVHRTYSTRELNVMEAYASCADWASTKINFEPSDANNFTVIFFTPWSRGFSSRLSNKTHTLLLSLEQNIFLFLPSLGIEVFQTYYSCLYAPLCLCQVLSVKQGSKARRVTLENSTKTWKIQVGFSDHIAEIDKSWITSRDRSDSPAHCTSGCLVFNRCYLQPAYRSHPRRTWWKHQAHSIS